jgi:hypothetical protein
MSSPSYKLHLPLLPILHPTCVKLSFYKQNFIKISTDLSTREVFHDPRDTLQAPRLSSMTKNKQLKQTSKRSVSSKDSKAPKIIKSSSSSGKCKLTSLQTPKEGSHKNDHDSDNSDDNKNNLSSKMTFWGSPDLYVGMDKLSRAI